jgi:cysteine desulfurase
VKQLIYLDHAATTRLHPKALDAMLPFLKDEFGNPSGTYTLGRRAERALESARSTVASVLGCRPQEVVFTGPGSESINAAIKGVAFAQQQAGMGNHIVTSAVEHHAVLHSLDYLERFGFETTVVPVDRYGRVDPGAVAAAIGPKTVLVSLMLANNEVGTIQPLAEVSAAVRDRAKALKTQVPIHTDAVQGVNALELDVTKLGVDLMSLSAHKFGGPKGAGVLYMKRGTPFLSQLSGGGQERQRRAGTEDVASISGLAAALAEAQERRADYVTATRSLGRRLVDGVLASVAGAAYNGHPEVRLPNNVHFSFEGAESDTILAALDKLGIAASAGSACTSATWEPSHVLTAMGIPLSHAVAALRLTLGAENTDEEIDRVLEVLPGVVAESRAKAGSGFSSK